ncbi:MAG: DEAD/DEAH box helicase [Bacteroidales bacterium]|nr:DEAD/DEAH box helicase [Bacteroidales bacterium]MBN2820582.1 DEAD/DEAH box helicase [Bacteroidales bacterium]
MNFTDFGFEPTLIEGIDALGFETPTPIQEQAIPIVLKGNDLIASAQTGTGKTAAFLLPIIQGILNKSNEGHIKALVIVPTRELAMQIDQMMQGISYFTSVSSIAVYGGSDGALFSREKQALSSGVDIVISTPGRLKSHLTMGNVKIDKLQYLVLDEADRMLDMGFYEDIVKIISYLPDKRQNLLFSATMPPKIRDLARKILYHPSEINIAVSTPAEKIKQEAFVVYNKQKNALAKLILKEKNFRSILIFCSTKLSVKELNRELKHAGFNSDEFHSDLEQSQREKILLKFKNREISMLVATDIMSRGIDVEDIDLVINYDVPGDGEDYIHRIGRTARAESEGEAITFINEKEQGKFQSIERLLGKEVLKAKVPKILGEAPEYIIHDYRKKKGNNYYNKKKKSRNFSKNNKK